MQHITATYVNEFYTTQSQEGTSRLGVFLETLANSEEQEVAKVAREVASKSETLKQRMSEMRQLFGALHQVEGFSVKPDVGYHAAIQAARDALASKGITWQGKPKLTKDERIQRKTDSLGIILAAKAYKEAKGNVTDLPEALQEVRIKECAKEAAQSAWKVMGKYGLTPEECSEVLELIQAHISEAIEADLEAEKEDSESHIRQAA